MKKNEKEMRECLYKDLMDIFKGQAREKKMKHFEMPEEPKIKAVISGDSPEDIIEGAKELPKAMSMAEKFMEAKLGPEALKEDKKKSKKA